MQSLLIEAWIKIHTYNHIMGSNGFCIKTNKSTVNLNSVNRQICLKCTKSSRYTKLFENNSEYTNRPHNHQLHHSNLQPKHLAFSSTFSTLILHIWPPCLHLGNRLIGLVVRRPPRERKVPGSNPICAGIFLGSSHTSDSKIGTPVATLPGAWRYRVSTGTGQPGVSIL